MGWSNFSLNGGSQSLLWGGSAALAAVLILLLYQTERKLVSAGVGLILLLFRLLVVVLVFLTLLEPVLTQSQQKNASARILVGVDLSESMSTVDTHASEAEKLRWARALELIGNPAINPRLDRWLAAMEAGKEPEWVDANETVDPDRRAALQRTRRENLEHVFETLSKLSRKEIAQRLLSATSAPLLPALDKVATVQLTAFAGRQETVDNDLLGKQIKQGSPNLQPGFSDLNVGMQAPSGDTNSRLIGVVLFTDGRDTVTRDVATAKRYGAMKVPVFPVLVGSTVHPKDLAFRNLNFPETVFKNDKAVLKAVLSTAGFDGLELEVVLERADKEPLSKKLFATGDETPIEFELDANELGRKEYTLRTAVQPGETRKDNNLATFAMTVVDDKVHVLVVEGEARWEFRFIEAALHRDKRVDLAAVVYQQPYLGLMPEGFFPRELNLPAKVEDLDTSPLAQADMIVIGDVASRDFPPQAWELLDRFVAESGGTLVLCAGKNDMPLGHASPVLQQLLPVVNPRPSAVQGADPFGSPNERGFHLRLTSEGAREAMFQFDLDEVQNRRVWSELPGHTWAMFGQAKPGATVFAAASIPGQADPLAAERNFGIFVHQHYGLGQVLWIGIDSTWRWRHRAGDKYHHRFWAQLARWAASNKATVGNEFVKFGPDKTDVNAGDDVVIRARWIQQFLRRFPNMQATVDIIPATGKADEPPLSSLPLKPLADRGLIQEARAVALPAGDYKLKLKVQGADLGDKQVEASVFVHRPNSAELADVSANLDLLRQIATASGGEVIYADQTARITKLLKPPEQSTETRLEISLWDHWLILLLFFILLTTEWVIRKLNGLP